MSATSSWTRATAGRPDPHHQVHRPAGRLAIVFSIRQCGVVGEAEQLGAVGAQLDDLGDERVGVVGVAIVAAIDECPPHLSREARGCRRRSAPDRPPSGC